VALTLRTNGSSGVNLVSAAWWNDYYNLLTGVMTDQIVTLKTDLILQGLSGAPAAPTLALAAGTSLSVGLYKYVVTFVDNNGGETLAGTSANITTTTGNQVIALSNIPLGTAGTAKRNCYRTKVGGSTYFLDNTLNDNTTTSYNDVTADTGLSGQNPPAHPSFGGTLTIQRVGVTNAQIFSDGAVSFDAGNITSDGAGNLSATTYKTNSGNTIPKLASNGGGATGANIWVGTTDPAGNAAEGDIWIDA
jgi:hypothetical protein